MNLTINDIHKLSIVFIVGRGRSGTSLLQTIFDTNPSVKTANESSFILHLKQKYTRVKIWNDNILNEFILDLYKDTKFAYLWGINPDDIKKNISLYALSDLSFPILCKIVYLTISSPFPKEKTTLIVDKNPIYSLFINDLIAVFPDAKFIHLIRDYRDNIISSRKAFKIKDIALLAQRWKRNNTYIEKIKKVYNSKFYSLKYEDLVNSPNTYISEICDFTGIIFQKEMLDFHKTTNKIYTNKSNEYSVMNDLVKNIHLNLLNPINTNQINQWNKELSISEIEIIDYITSNFATQYSYIGTTNKFKVSYIIISIKSCLKYYIDFFVYKCYYMLPFSIRDFLKKLSLKLFKKFGYFNNYNKIELEYQKK